MEDNRMLAEDERCLKNQSELELNVILQQEEVF